MAYIGKPINKWFGRENHMMKCPIGLTIMALVLGCLALASVGYVPVNPAPLPRLTLLVHSIAAIAAAIGLWKMRSWASVAFLFWAVLMVFTIIEVQFGQYHVAWQVFVCIVFLFWLLVTYVERTLSKGV
jgi:hypothetical protein